MRGRRPQILADDDFRTVDFGGFADGSDNPPDEFRARANGVPGRRSGEIEEAHRASRIVTDAKKAPIILARQIVERHIRELRARALVEVPPNTPSLIMALEQLTHDVASAILDARKAPR